MERRAIRDRVALDRHQVMRNLMLKGDLSEWIEHRVKELETSQVRKQTENVALMRNLLRGSKRRKRAIISELQSGSLRRALSEDELGPGDDTKDDAEDEDESPHEYAKDVKHDFKYILNQQHNAHPILLDLHASSDQRRRRHAGQEVSNSGVNHEMQGLANNLESLTVQSEFGFPSTMQFNGRHSMMGLNQHHHYNMSYYHGHNSPYLVSDSLAKHKSYEGQSQSLQVSDHPHVYQNTAQAMFGSSENHTKGLNMRRNSIR